MVAAGQLGPGRAVLAARCRAVHNVPRANPRHTWRSAQFRPVKPLLHGQGWLEWDVQDLPPQSSPSPGRPALTAFLHGIEVRAWVFALNQCADPDRARKALALGLEDFVGRARDLPLARWPGQFWASLLAQPALLTDAGAQPGLPGCRPVRARPCCCA